jgi:hypothetical protein
VEIATVEWGWEYWMPKWNTEDVPDKVSVNNLEKCGRNIPTSS